MKGVMRQWTLQSGEAHKDVRRSSHAFMPIAVCQMLSEKKGEDFLKTKCPFYLEVENVPGIEGESCHSLKNTMSALSYLILKAIPQQSHFPDEKTETHRSS